MFKIALTSDTHLGATSEAALHSMFEKMAGEGPDIVVHAGDYNGGSHGASAVLKTCEIMRQYLPKEGFPIVSVIGNHDVWCKYNPSLGDFIDNYESIKKAFKLFDIHFLDEDGPFVPPEFPNYVLLGHSLWYKDLRPPTNDLDYMPLYIEGNTHAWMYRNAYKAAEEQLKIPGLLESWKTPIYVTHFPILGIYSVIDNAMGGCPHFGDMLQTFCGITRFLNGHTHFDRNGPLQWECGSDYGYPRYKILEF